MYGVPAKVPISEDNPRQPVNPYGVSKLFFENALEAHDRAYGMKFAALRYFNAAGADEGGKVANCTTRNHLISSAIAGSLEGKRKELKLFRYTIRLQTAAACGITFT